MRQWFIAGALLANAGLIHAEEAGAALYAAHCIACHQPGAVGAPGVAPPLAGNIGRHTGNAAGRDYLVRVPLTGMVGTITVDGIRYYGNMPSLSALSDTEIAAVLGHVLRNYDGIADLAWLTPEFVAEVRKGGGTPNDTHKLRGRLATATGS